MKKKTWVMLPKSLIAVLIFAAVVTAIYIYDKNLLPVGNVSLKPGKYVWDQDSKASITISEDGRMTFYLSEEDRMEVDYYPREDKLLLFKPRSEDGYTFMLEK